MITEVTGHPHVRSRSPACPVKFEEPTCFAKVQKRHKFPLMDLFLSAMNQASQLIGIGLMTRCLRSRVHQPST